ncbi:hypothetical protein BCON_0050g00330 [Botryotinia convoluta]|uniref:O-methyltransferase C-terminal domain-containing protein n=1 Tax=Botryotinia convoluta TaxID=54673 RepID=A0A4Z1IBA7_9HELO|nr:hypothetical protein BCON_0050g00330 [Botryotinia convoluta]
MGGSQGAMCIDLARHYPKMKCISQDLPDVVEGIETPEEVRGRVETVEHDFFTEQPVKGADTYLFRTGPELWQEKFAYQNLTAKPRVGKRDE